MESFGRYQLIAKLATGGMAQVFLAREKPGKGVDPDKLVVVKRILPHLAENDEFVRMFLQEARVVARLHHPGIAGVLDVGVIDGTYFIVMEYVHGEDVRRLVRQATQADLTLPVPLACRIVADAAQGLHFAHEAVDEHGKPLSLVHRDVSPQNILVGFDGVVKVIDFGIAKAADSANFTRTGVLKGKYAYMSPEQAEGRKLDRRSDVFALGIVLYELVTQRRLFKRQSDMATVQAVTACEVPRPRVANPALDAELESILLQALARDANDRTPTAGDFAKRLDQWLTKRAPGQGGTRELSAFAREVYAERMAEEDRLGRPVLDSGPIPAFTPETTRDPVTDSAPLLTPTNASSESQRIPTNTDPVETPSGLSRAAAGNALGGVPSDAEAEATTDGRPRRSPLAEALRSSEAATTPALPGTTSPPPHPSASAPTPLATPIIAPPLAAKPLKPGNSGPIVDDSPTDRMPPPSKRKQAPRSESPPPRPPPAPSRPPIPPPVPSKELPRYQRPSSPVVAPVVLDGELSEISRIVRRRRNLRWVNFVFVIALLVAIGWGAWWLAGRPDFLRGSAHHLTLETDPPGAELFLDDQPTGRRSPARFELAPGRTHIVEARLDGYLPASATIPATDGDLARTLHLIPQKAPKPKPAPDKLAPARDEAPHGTIDVDTTPPGTTIEVDGRVLGRTPLTAVDLPAGPHVIRFLDVDRFVDQRLAIDVAAGRNTRFEKNLVARPVKFAVTPAARVFVAGRHLVDAPGDTELVPGKYDVSYVRDGPGGKRTHRANLEVPEGGGPFVVTIALPGP